MTNLQGNSSRKFYCSNQRRAILLEKPGQTLNGIKFLEVIDQEDVNPSLRQRRLLLHLFRPAVLGRENIRFEGGIRIRPVRLSADPKVDLNDATIIHLEVEQPGDFSLYTLRLVKAVDDGQPPVNFDPQLSAVVFSFKIECPDDLDCAPVQRQSAEGVLKPPNIDYLARDYATYRRLILDRLAVTLPDWNERSPADLLVTMAEALAYAADHLSYMQDAVASEMYLDTSRLRSSVRRHTRLLDYPLHQGCNARVWVAFQASETVYLPSGLPLLTQPAQDVVALALQGKLGLSDQEGEQAIQAGSQVYELMIGGVLFPANNRLEFYTWMDENCCLPKGTHQVTLKDSSDPQKRLLLRPGDVVILEELLSKQGPSGLEKRHAVRLTKVVPEAIPAVLVTSSTLILLAQDGLTQNEINILSGIGQPDLKQPIKESDFYAQVILQLGAVDEKRLRPKLKRRLPAVYRVPGTLVTDPLSGQPVVEVEWGLSDALPVDYCLSASTSGVQTENMSIAWGNILPADHGLSLPPEALAKIQPGRAFRPRLKEPHLVFSTPYRSVDPISAQPFPATAFSLQEAAQALPSMFLLDDGEQIWRPQRDLLNSDRFAREFVVEIEEDGLAALRFGLPGAGRAPEDSLRAFYRVGEPLQGNMGPESLRFFIAKDAAQLSDLKPLVAIRNPMPAKGGKPPEALEKAKLSAPYAFRRQERAVTSEDYARMTERHPQTQRAAATRRWTGSWYTQFISVDRQDGLAIDPAFEEDLRLFLERFRLAGQDLEIDTPDFVPLEIEMNVCLKPGFFPGKIHADLLTAFSNGDLPDGGQGFFHPDRFTFGQALYLSQLISAAMAVPGVDWVEVIRLRRWGGQDDKAIEDGYLMVNRLEIIRLDNDLSVPEYGRISFNLREQMEIAP